MPGSRSGPRRWSTFRTRCSRSGTGARWRRARRSLTSNIWCTRAGRNGGKKKACSCIAWNRRGHREHRVTLTDPEVANESADLLAHLIRNACVNDGTPESGYESRSADVLAQYLGDTGLELERFAARAGRDNLVARIEGTDPNAPTLLLMGHTDVVPVNVDGWRRVPFGGAHRFQTERHARLSRGGRRREPRYLGCRAPARARERRFFQR